MANGKRPLIAEDLFELKKVADVHLSPDGQSVIYATEHIDHKTEKKFTDMWVAPLHDGQPRQITQENQPDNQIRWLNKYAK
jgi:dipeptidyl aminopeptidase/acylaminoacyl peptidase